MGESRVSIVAGVMVEQAGDALLVLVPSSNQVVTLTGEARGTLQLVQAGEPVAWSQTVAELVRLGVLTESLSPSRRGVIKAGALAGMVGVATLSMPSLAAASSQQATPEVALTFTNVNGTVPEGGRYIVRVTVLLPVGFVAPVPDPVPISARVETDEVGADFLTLRGASRADWYLTAKEPHLLLWNISTEARGWQATDGEVFFSWGSTNYRATGPITAVVFLAPQV